MDGVSPLEQQNFGGGFKYKFGCVVYVKSQIPLLKKET
jgi:hypothetical protein